MTRGPVFRALNVIGVGLRVMCVSTKTRELKRASMSLSVYACTTYTRSSSPHAQASYTESFRPHTRGA
jgi:hypothetical protein